MRAADASSLELRAYVRDEYGSNEAWLLAHAGSRRIPWRTRLRRWWSLRTRRSRAAVRASVAAMTEAGPDAGPRPVPSACLHFVVEELGSDGPTRFIRCSGCGAVLVMNTRSVWRFDSPSDWPRPDPVPSLEPVGDDPRIEAPDA